MTAPGPACAGSRVDFHDPAQEQAAMAICARCPIAAACLAAAEARQEPCGVWGGVPFGQAPAMVVAEGFVRPSVRARHGVRGVPCTAGPDGGRCNDCRRVHASYVRDWRLHRQPAVVTRLGTIDLPEQLALAIEGISA